MSSSDPLRRRWMAAAAAFAAAALAGCGFQLRAVPSLPFQRIALSGFTTRSELALALRRALEGKVTVTADVASADVVLYAMVDAREKTVVAQTAAAQVREFQLRQRFRFRVATPAGRELVPPSALLLARDMSYSESVALAKEQEEGELFREMQADIVQQVVRRLASIRL